MIETRDAEINIEELKSRIRRAVERREAEGRTSFGKDATELFALLSEEDFSPEVVTADCSAGDEFIRLAIDLSHQSDFVRPSDDRYHVKDLLKYHDRQFVWNAYLALLKREPDEEGFTRFLEKLQSGQLNKIEVLARLRYSPEGKRKKVTIDGLRIPALLRRLYRLPLMALSWSRRVSLRSKLGSTSAQ